MTDEAHIARVESLTMAQPAWTADQARAISAWLAAKWPDSITCSNCRQDTIMLSGHPAQIILGGPGGSVELGHAFPAIVLLCTNCGNMLFINAVVAGIEWATDKEGSNG